MSDTNLSADEVQHVKFSSTRSLKRLSTKKIVKKETVNLEEEFDDDKITKIGFKYRFKID